MNKLGPVILACTLIGCGNQNEGDKMNGQKLESMSGWILVANGSLEEVKAAIIDYDALVKEKVPGTFKVELHEQKDGSIAVIFPDGLPSYDMANITVWLDAPPNQKNIYGAKSWVVSPSGATKYFLKPEVENDWGDTLIGSSEEGKAIRVYVPETGVSEMSQSVQYEKEPSVSLSPKSVSFAITLDTEISWANPKFSVNKPLNYDWKN